MTNKTTRTRTEAKKLMWEYYRDNRSWLPGWITEFREDVIKLLVEGKNVTEVFNEIVQNVESDTVNIRAA